MPKYLFCFQQNHNNRIITKQNRERSLLCSVKSARPNSIDHISIRSKAFQRESLALEHPEKFLETVHLPIFLCEKLL